MLEGSDGQAFGHGGHQTRILGRKVHQSKHEWWQALLGEGKLGNMGQKGTLKDRVKKQSWNDLDKYSQHWHQLVSRGYQQMAVLVKRLEECR